MMQKLIMPAIMVVGGLYLAIRCGWRGSQSLQPWARRSFLIAGMACMISGALDFLLRWHFEPRYDWPFAILSTGATMGGIVIGIFISLYLSGQFAKIWQAGHSNQDPNTPPDHTR